MTQTPSHPARNLPVWNIGGVSYLNAKPLLYGLEDDPGIHLVLDVPAGLLDGLRRRAFDVALLPVIDYQKMEGLRILPVGGIGSSGPTLTVRIFSPNPIETIDTLACDPDSHTSVALAQVILHQRWGLRPRLVPIHSAGARTARLLIGDKVVCEEPPDMPHQMDLGAAWKEMTAMPFVFAVWTARSGADLGDLPQRLESAKHRGMENVDAIIARDAAVRRWPVELARQYLTHNLRFDVGPAELNAIRHFHKLAAGLGLIPSPPREILIY